MLSIRLTICFNDCPVGLRLQRKAPLPNYDSTYDNTDDGMKKAKKDMAALQKYIDEYHTLKLRK